MIEFGRPVAPEVERRLPLPVHALVGDGRIDAIWLFGSRARQEADALSDVDVAVLARRDLPHRRAVYAARALVEYLVRPPAGRGTDTPFRANPDHMDELWVEDRN